ncbi:MAG: TetR/AcrR family transcriptional regulator [Deltaproteobacteria bacterium]|nr:TetR/AcrR family transcriptional regulator [Deltaproteobacteria bacterium]
MTRRRPSIPPAPPTPEATTEARILGAADALFCTVGGYDGVSTRDVAERAGVNKALVFYHFGSMRGLFEAVLERYYEAHQRGLAEALSGVGDVRARMHRLVDAYLDFMATHARYATLVQAQLANPDTHALVEKSFEPLYRFIEEALLEVAPREGRAAARQLFVTFSGAVINWCTYAPLLSRVLGDDPLGSPLLEERRAHVRWLVDLVLDALERSEGA